MFFKTIYDTWRSILSFFLSFVLLAAMIVMAPDWATWLVETSQALKEGVVGFLGLLPFGDNMGAGFSLFVPDTGVALALFTLFTRLVVVTLMIWLGSLVLGGGGGHREHH